MNFKRMSSVSHIFIHLIFTVKNREGLIYDKSRETIRKYLTGIIKNKGHKLIAVECMKDHAHILFEINPNQSLSHIVRDIKANSSRFISENNLAKNSFKWQEGYAAFSYGKSQLSNIIAYINNQEQHHLKKSFSEEYEQFIAKYL